jgi:hypothetical protein
VSVTAKTKILFERKYRKDLGSERIQLLYKVKKTSTHVT